MIDFQITGPGSSIQVETLRDKYAMAALTGILAGDPKLVDTLTANEAHSVVSLNAFKFADSMMAARQKGGAS